MNREDEARWDRKYRVKDPPAVVTPDPFLAAHLGEIPPGRALEVACGFGDNAITLARAGFHVTAIDISSVVLERARSRSRAAGVQVDFRWTDAEGFDFGESVYDLIAGFYFLNRPVFAAIRRGLKPGGILLYKTYTREEVRYRPSLNPDYLLAPGELRAFFRDFAILFYDEQDDGAECSAKIVARR